jgi:hypothetical protein
MGRGAGSGRRLRIARIHALRGLGWLQRGAETKCFAALTRPHHIWTGRNSQTNREDNSPMMKPNSQAPRPSRPHRAPAATKGPVYWRAEIYAYDENNPATRRIEFRHQGDVLNAWWGDAIKTDEGHKHLAPYEKIMEQARRDVAPNAPSRLTSIFAIPSDTKPSVWENEFLESSNIRPRRLIAIRPTDPTKVVQADAYWFGKVEQFVNKGKPKQAYEAAVRYWRGEKIPQEEIAKHHASAMPEVLIGGSAVVVKGNDPHRP